jgi:hypothetical protein
VDNLLPAPQRAPLVRLAPVAQQAPPVRLAPPDLALRFELRHSKTLGWCPADVLCLPGY